MHLQKRITKRNKKQSQQSDMADRLALFYFEKFFIPV